MKFPLICGEPSVIALIVRGAAEDRAGAVFHQHEIGDVNRQLFPVDKRMQGANAGFITQLFSGLDRNFAGPQALAFGDECCGLGVGFRDGQRQRVVRGQSHETGPE